ncbi:MAG: helix-turn-helix transcriptional regulator, partial [Sediminispirochaetaceae bacterium]
MHLPTIEKGMLRQGFTCYTNCVKTDRLLSIIIYLLNRDLVSARELAEKFEVSVRTIQRDMEAIELAGIPIMTIQGPSGGYSIMDSFKLDRQLVSTDDLFFIITALHGIETSLPAGSISGTIEKMKTLLPDQKGVSNQQGGAEAPAGRGLRDSRGKRNPKDLYGSRLEKLSIDFSAFGGSERQREVFRQLERAIESEVLVS